MSMGVLIWKGMLALIGCIASAYVGQELLGGGALGWAAGGAILAVTCGPLFTTLLEWRKRRRLNHQARE
jgi:hypothetical protein